MTGPYVVRHLEPAVGYDVTWGAEPIVERGARVVSVKAFEALEGDEGAREFIRAAVPEPHSFEEALDFDAAIDALPAEGGKVELPDGREIVVEAVERAYWGLWHATPEGRRGGPFMELEGFEIVAAFNEWAAERYGTEAPR